MSKRAILLPISGLLGAVVKDLYKKCEADLQAAFPDKKVRCIGTPFPNAPFPLLAQKHLARYPEEQVVRSWSRMVGFAIRARPIIEEADIVVCRRLGLDIVLYAAACEGWDDRKATALRIHHSMVKNTLVGELGIQIPDGYIIPQAANGTCRGILLSTFPQLGELSPEILSAFLDRQKRVVEEDYFNPSTGQNRPFFVDAAKPVDEMFADVVEFARKNIELYQPG